MNKAALRNNSTLIMIAIFVFSLTLRLIYLYQIRTNPFFNNPILDGLYYDKWAQEIAKGDFIGKGVSYGNPLYAYFLGLAYKLFGRNLFFVRLIQHALGAFSCVLIYSIGSKVFNRTVGIISAVMASIYGIFIFYEGELGLDSLALFFATLSIFLLLYAKDNPLKRNWFSSGVVSGLFMLARANIAPLAVFIWILCVYRGKGIKKAAVYYLIYLLGMILAIAPITAKNYIASKEIVFITAHGGETFYVGNNPEADGTCKEPDFVMPNTMEEHEDFRRMASTALGRQVSLQESSRYWLNEAMRFIREDPGRYTRLLLKKTALFFSGREISDNQQYYFFRNYSPLLKLPLLAYGTVFPLFLIGAAISIKKWREALLLYIFSILYSASIIAYFITSRYRMIAVPFFMIFGAYALYRWSDNLRNKRYLNAAAASIAFLVLAVIVNAEGVMTGLDTGHYNLARVCQEKGMDDEAIKHYLKAAELNPDHHRIYVNLGGIYQKKGFYDKALEQYGKALKLKPDDYKTLNNIGSIYKRTGSLNEAISYYERALKLKPDYPLCLNSLGDTYIQAGNHAEAVRCFKKAVESEPDNYLYNANLGTAYILNGDNDNALRFWRRSLEIDPDQPNLVEYIKRNE